MKNSGPVLFDIPERNNNISVTGYSNTLFKPSNTNQKVVDIIQRREANREDIKNWFLHKGGQCRMETIMTLSSSKQLSKFSNLINGFNQQSNFPYYLPPDIHAFYELLTGEDGNDIENILPRVYNLLSPNEKTSWYMGKVEFHEWYYSSDEVGKTGKDYIIDGLRHNFSIVWKQKIAELNKRRKFQGKGILNTTRSTMISHVGASSPISLSEFLALLEEDAEETQKILQIEKQAKHEQQARIYSAQQKQIEKQPLSPKDVQKIQGVHTLTTGMYNMFKPLTETDI